MSDLRGRAGQRAPGWYRDPEDPTHFRHWNGRTWSSRRRSWPAWDVSVSDLVADTARPGGPDSGSDGGPVYDGPVRSVPLPAGALRNGLGTDAGLAWLQRVTPVAGRRARQGRPRTRYQSGPGTAGSPGWAPSRRPLAVFAGLVALAVLFMAVSVGLSRPRTATVGAVAGDTAYLRQASTICDSGLAPIRRDSAAAMTASASSPATLAAAAQRDAMSASTTAARLSALRPAGPAVGAVQGWLQAWGSYEVDQRALAGSLHAEAAGAPATAGDPDTDQLAQRVISDVAQADQFAEANGLGDCRLGSDNSPAGPVVPIP